MLSARPLFVMPEYFINSGLDRRFVMTLAQSVYETINEAWAGPTLEALKEFVRLPAKSRNFNSHWETDGVLKAALLQAADWGKQRFANAEFRLIEKPGIPPALFVRIPSKGGHTGSPAFFYGHLDKQPETTGWRKGLAPWTPVVENGRLYGRGAADDGYNYYLTLTAVEALEKNAVPHPEIMCLFETDEESGSADLEDYIQSIAPEVGSPAFIAIADLGASDYSRVWLTQSLRGIIALTLNVRVLNTPSHSGSASGIVPSSFRIARMLLERIENAETGEIRIPELNPPVPTEISECIRRLSESEDPRKQFDWAGHTHSPCTTAYDAMLTNTWKPSLSIIGADGLPNTHNAGNLVREETSLRLSFRTPPTANAHNALTAIKSILTANPPYGAEVTVTDTAAESGFETTLPSGRLGTLLNLSCQTHFGHDIGFTFCGASIGTLPAFKRAFPDAPFINTGALGPESNAHAPNECLNLEYTKKLTCVFADLIAGIPEGNEL